MSTYLSPPGNSLFLPSPSHPSPESQRAQKRQRMTSSQPQGSATYQQTATSSYHLSAASAAPSQSQSNPSATPPQQQQQQQQQQPRYSTGTSSSQTTYRTAPSTSSASSAAAEVGVQVKYHHSPTAAHAALGQHSTGGGGGGRASIAAGSGSGGASGSGGGGGNTSLASIANVEHHRPRPAEVSAPPAPHAPPTTGEDVGVQALRVREESGAETFAIPLEIVNSWETLIPALQTTFGKDGHPKLMNSRGDTIARLMLQHFLKDGMLLLVSFPPTSTRLGTGALAAAASKLPPASTSTSSLDASTSQTHVSSSSLPHKQPVNGTSNSTSNNPPTPYSPPTATPPLYTPANAPTSNTTSNPSGAPTYKLSRTIHSVEELWREWQEGLNGSPSVKSLEEEYGPKWRTSQAERKFYSRRKVVVDEVRKLIDQGSMPRDAVAAVEAWREGRSLDALSKMIVERRKTQNATVGQQQQQGQREQAVGGHQMGHTAAAHHHAADGTAGMW